jgi:hypothetical protein
VRQSVVSCSAVRRAGPSSFDSEKERQGRRPLRIALFFHVTTPEAAASILDNGFKDSAAKKGFLGIVTHEFQPGVWFADVPPITAISVDQFLGHRDEAWIAISVTEEEFHKHFRGNEWQDPSWPTRQWLIAAEAANNFPRCEIPLVEVLRMRIANDSTEHHRFITADILRECILSEMNPEEPIQARWLAALDEVERELR